MLSFLGGESSTYCSRCLWKTPFLNEFKKIWGHDSCARRKVSKNKLRHVCMVGCGLKNFCSLLNSFFILFQQNIDFFLGFSYGCTLRHLFYFSVKATATPVKNNSSRHRAQSTTSTSNATRRGATFPIPSGHLSAYVGSIRALHCVSGGKHQWCIKKNLNGPDFCVVFSN